MGGHVCELHPELAVHRPIVMDALLGSSGHTKNLNLAQVATAGGKWSICCLKTSYSTYEKSGAIFMRTCCDLMLCERLYNVPNPRINIFLSDMKGQLEYEVPHTKDVCSKLKEEGVPQILWKEGRLHGSDDDKGELPQQLRRYHF